MMNLGAETREVLDRYGYKLADVVSVTGCSQDAWTIENFLEVADGIEYDESYGAQEVNEMLTIWLADGSRFERGEYDGSEWWELFQIVKAPEPEPKAKPKVADLLAGGWTD